MVVNLPHECLYRKSLSDRLLAKIIFAPDDNKAHSIALSHSECGMHAYCCVQLGIHAMSLNRIMIQFSLAHRIFCHKPMPYWLIWKTSSSNGRFFTISTSGSLNSPYIGFALLLKTILMCSSNQSPTEIDVL